MLFRSPAPRVPRAGAAVLELVPRSVGRASCSAHRSRSPCTCAVVGLTVAHVLWCAVHGALLVCVHVVRGVLCVVRVECCAVWRVFGRVVGVRAHA